VAIGQNQDKNTSAADAGNEKTFNVPEGTENAVVKIFAWDGTAGAYPLSENPVSKSFSAAPPDGGASESAAYADFTFSEGASDIHEP
jgi:hypothetical protein